MKSSAQIPWPGRICGAINAVFGAVGMFQFGRAVSELSLVVRDPSKSVIQFCKQRRSSAGCNTFDCISPGLSTIFSEISNYLEFGNRSCCRLLLWADTSRRTKDTNDDQK